MQSEKRHWAPLIAAVMTVSCTGNLGGDPLDGADDATSTDPLTCAPGEISPSVLPRLSHAQYLASLSALVESTLGTGQGPTILDGLAGLLVSVPTDGDADHDRLDQSVSQAHVDGQYFVAVAFAEALTATSERVTAVVGACATDADPSNDGACLEDFIRDFGRLAHHRPLTDDQVAFYRDEVFAPADGLDPAALRDVITVMVLSPWFLYHVEHEGQPVDGHDGRFELGGYELAARLSFHFWNAPPDDALMDAAESGALDTEEGYLAQVDRLVADPRTRSTIDRLFVEWLAMDDIAPLHQSVGTPKYDAFVGADVPTEALRDRMVEDALDLVRYVTWDSGGDFEELFLTDRSFAKTEDVAAIYGGVSLWSEGEEPPTLPAGQRAGLLTRPAMLATGSTITHPVLRGREVRRRILCDNLPPPPANAMDALPELDPTMSEREQIDAMTGSGSCAGCHTQMNPIGFSLGNYDGLGRFRTTETILDDSGAVLATLPIDAVAAPLLTSDSDAVVDGGIELSEAVAATEQVKGCFARHYFRFTFSRVEDDALDCDALTEIETAISEGLPLEDALRGIALSPTFRQRQLAADE